MQGVLKEKSKKLHIMCIFFWFSGKSGDFSEISQILDNIRYYTSHLLNAAKA